MTKPPTTQQIRDKMRDIFNDCRAANYFPTFDHFDQASNKSHWIFNQWLDLYKQAERKLK